MITSESYYGNTSNYGNYQFSTLDGIVDSLMLEALEEEDHYLRNTKKFLLQKYAKESVKELALDISGEVRPLAFILNSSLQVIVPQDYVNYARISVLNEDGFAVPLNVNPNTNLTKKYLLDSNSEIVFDSEGEAIETRGGNPEGGFKYLSVHKDYCGGNYQKDYSKFSKNGEFVIDTTDGIISFSSNLVGATIILEYVSDGLFREDVKDGDIRIQKYLEKAIMDLTYLKAIDRRRTVPLSEKTRALNRFNKTRHKAVMQRANFNLEEFRKAMSSINKSIKI